MVAFVVTVWQGILPRMSDQDDELDAGNKKKGFHLRMPPWMRERIDEARKETGNSVNQEVLDRLAASLRNEPSELLKVIRDLQAAVDRLTMRLDEKDK